MVDTIQSMLSVRKPYSQSISLSPFSKARRNLPQGIRGLCNYQMDLESKGQEGHSWFSENLDRLELQEGHCWWFQLPEAQKGWFLEGCMEAASRTCVLPVYEGTVATAKNNFFSFTYESNFYWWSLSWNHAGFCLINSTSKDSGKYSLQESPLGGRGECRRNWNCADHNLF